MEGDLNNGINPGAYPGVRVAILLIVGILLGNWLQLHIFYWLALLLTNLLILIAGYQINRASPFQSYAYLFIVIIFGATWFILQNQEKKVPELRLVVVEENITFYGDIQNVRTTARGHAFAIVQIDSVKVPHAGVWDVSFPTYVRTFNNRDSSTLKAGNYISFEGVIAEPSKPRNPNEFDFPGYLKSQNIYTVTTLDRIIFSQAQSSVFSWLYWSEQVKRIIDRLYSHENAPLAKALLLGDRDELSQDIGTAFSRAGIAHFMAVSGMHVGFVLLPFWLMIPYFWLYRFGRLLFMVMIIGILFFYSGITGFSASVVRASVMALLFMYGKLYQKPGESLNLLGIAAIVILIGKPTELFAIGFQLSFTAVWIILIMLPVIRHYMPVRLRESKTEKVILLVAISILVQVGLYPLLLYYFNEYSLIGPFSNVISVFFVQLLFLWSIFCLLVEALVPGIGVWLNVPSNWIIYYLSQYAEYVTSNNWSWFVGAVGTSMLFPVWVSAFMTLASVHKPNLRWKMLVSFLFCLCLYQGHLLFQERTKTLTITVFDVGQGDAILLQSPNGKNILYDTGIQSFYQNSAERVILPELKARNIQSLDAVILSHPHADHIGGISALIRNIPIKVIYDSGIPSDSNVYQEYLEQVLLTEIPVVKLKWGDVIDIDESMRFFVTGPHPNLAGSNPNRWSVVVRAVYGNTSILLTGDADIQSENKMVDYFGDFLQSDLLKVAHHGSQSSSGDYFLNAVQPTYSTVSLASNNRYNHPHPDATNRLKKSGTRTLFTSLNGALVFTSNGEILKHEKWRK